MGPGVDPHLYRPRKSDVVAISDAQLIFYNGLHLEGKMGEIFAHMQKYKSTVAVSDCLERNKLLQSDYPNIYDPHIWHDVSLWIQVVEYIHRQLCEHFPEHKDTFSNNKKHYVDTLIQLNEYVRTQVERLPNDKKILVTGHDAFSYFGKAYGIEVVSLQGISTDAQVSGKDISNLTQLIVEQDVPALFLESSIPSGSIRAVQEAVAARGKKIIVADELYSDALGDPGTTSGSYDGMIKHNITTIICALHNECT